METNREQGGTATGDDFLEVDVDYGANDAEYAANFRALVEEGAYVGFCDPDATPEHYPTGGLRGKHRRRIHLIKPAIVPGQEHWTNKNVMDGVAANPHGKVQIHPFDLLALCAKHPRLGLKFPLAASFENTFCVPGGDRIVLCVTASRDGRDLRMRCLGDGYWPLDCRFPVLCEVPKP